jgi:hypothetical protein
LNVDEKLESFLSRDPAVETRRIQVFGDRESAETESDPLPESARPALKIVEVFHAEGPML